MNYLIDTCKDYAVKNHTTNYVDGQLVGVFVVSLVIELTVPVWPLLTRQSERDMIADSFAR